MADKSQQQTFTDNWLWKSSIDRSYKSSSSTLFLIIESYPISISQIYSEKCCDQITTMDLKKYFGRKSMMVLNYQIFGNRDLLLGIILSFICALTLRRFRLVFDEYCPSSLPQLGLLIIFGIVGFLRFLIGDTLWQLWMAPKSRPVVLYVYLASQDLELFMSYWKRCYLRALMIVRSSRFKYFYAISNRLFSILRSLRRYLRLHDDYIRCVLSLSSFITNIAGISGFERLGLLFLNTHFLEHRADIKIVFRTEHDCVYIFLFPRHISSVHHTDRRWKGRKQPFWWRHQRERLSFQFTRRKKQEYHRPKAAKMFSVIRISNLGRWLCSGRKSFEEVSWELGVGGCLKGKKGDFTVDKSTSHWQICKSLYEMVMVSEGAGRTSE